MKKIHKIIGVTFIFLFAFAFILSIASAEGDLIVVDPLKDKDTNSIYTLLAPIGKLVQAPDNMGDYFNIIFKIVIGLCGALAVVMIVIGGVQYMGDESIFGKTEAKSRITSAIFGLLIALGAYALLNTINPDLLGGGGVSIDQVSAEIGEEPILSDSGKTVPTGTKNTFIECPGGVRSVQVTGYPNVQHFIFCSAYAGKLQLMFSDAYKANPRIALSGGGFRTYEEQLQIRRNNKCPNILTSPANKCKPPTAIPGTSLHEQGLAVDLRCDGVLINFDDQNPKYAKTPATKKCFDWLKANAGKYGFKNLASENWHWSTGPRAGH